MNKENLEDNCNLQTILKHYINFIDNKNSQSIIDIYQILKSQKNTLFLENLPII